GRAMSGHCLKTRHYNEATSFAYHGFLRCTSLCAPLKNIGSKRGSDYASPQAVVKTGGKTKSTQEKTMKTIVRIILVKLLLVACATTPVLADGGGPVPACWPKPCSNR